MTSPTYDQAFWERLWRKTLREHPDKVARRSPSAHLTIGLEDLPPGAALDAGCGHGAESLWLASRGWQVTALDFSPAALEHARAMARAAGEPVTGRLQWVCGDLASWAPEPDRYDLVVSLYVHVSGEVEALVRRLAAGVAPGGTLLVVGYQPDDLASDAALVPRQVQVSVAAAVAALDPTRWILERAEEHPRAAGSGVDAVIRARRKAG